MYYVGAQYDRACTLQATRQDGYTSGLGAQGRANRRRGEEGARRGGHDVEQPDGLRGPKRQLGRSGEPHQLADFVLDELDFAHDNFAVGSIQKAIDNRVHYTVDGNEYIRDFRLGCTQNNENLRASGHPTSVRIKQNLTQ